MRRRFVPLLAVALSASVLSACGSKEAVVTHGETEATYVDVGPKGGPYVKYQVQVSRQLNPGNFLDRAEASNPQQVDPEDSEYLRGLTPQQTSLATDRAKPINDQVYFGVFIAAYNQEHRVLNTAPTQNFEIVDTAGETFSPIVPTNPNDPPNPFLYRPAPIGARSGVQPPPDSPAGTSTTQGELLVFKIPQSSLENRPLTLHIKGATGGEAEIDLDV